MFKSRNDTFCLSLSLLILSYLLGTNVFGQSEDLNKTTKAPLKGAVEESGLAPARARPVAPQEPLLSPVVPKLEQQNPENAEILKEEKSFQAEVSRSGLRGRAEAEQSNDGLVPMNGKAAPQDGVLKGSAIKDDDNLASEDPDGQDQELLVEWDRWRNRFLQAILAGAMENLNNPDATDFRWDPVRQKVMTQFPLGTISWFACNISNDRHVSNLRLMKSSGYANYDQAVLNAVRSLEGTTILRFPTRSRRRQVSQAGGVKTSDQSQQQYFKFGDVEHVRVPGY